MLSLNITQKKRIIAVGVVILVLFLDQLIKVLVKTHFFLHETRRITDWSYLYFTENKGMAFGWDFMGTLFLCGFRIVAVCILCYYLAKVIRQNVPVGFIVCVSLVLAGAAGNIFDNLFYGEIFTESQENQVSMLVPFGQGYGSLLSGRVVDMFYFPIIDTILPDWIPFKGGERFIFFSPIFNFADASITCGGFLLILCYHRTFSVTVSKSKKEETSN